ncbi:MAG: hypothetical protein ABF379_17195 [Akkermansiaceae bacterium]
MLRKSDVGRYIAAQVVGGLAGSGVLAVIATGYDSFRFSDGFTSNGFGDKSP